MKYIFYALSFLFISSSTVCFSQWTTEDLTPMPVRVSNNAVVSTNDYSKVYSFSGIDSTKLYSGIHLKSFKYDVLLDEWTTLPDLPDTLGKIAAGASCVKDKIYIVGGYHVLANGNEVSSDKVHVYNTITESYEADALNVPIAIDDHVQAVWKDSLIFVVTGWSNTGNVPNVQIFNPSLNTWEVGTSTPNNNDYRAFGPTGKIIGDTIFYYGGVAGSFNFTAQNHMRKGVINPQDPTDITWSLEEDAPELAGYRAASMVYENSFLVLGGANVGYNYDGIAYNGSGGVDPEGRILKYDTELKAYNIYQFLPEIMDFRGEGQVANNAWITCGGMESQQMTSNRVVKYTLNEAQFVSVNEELPYDILENNSLQLNEVGQISIYQVDGKIVDQKRTQLYNLNSLPKGIHIIHIQLEKEQTTFKWGK